MAGGLFSRFAPWIKELPPGPLTPPQRLNHRFLLASEGDVSIYYAPFEHMRRTARVVLVGITPGFTQMAIAYQTARDGLRADLPVDEIFDRVTRQASFAGTLRVNLTRMLDEIGLPDLLGITSSATLFADHSELLHSTAALRNPAFVNGKNYTGSRPSIETPLLRNEIKTLLAPQLDALPSAIIVPLGGTAERALGVLIEAGQLEPSRCCLGMPHPSGANGHRARLFAERRDELAATLSDWFTAER